MSTTARTGSGAAPGSWARYGGLALVMVGALSVSVHGQVQAVAPLLGPMSIVLAMTHDLAALLALNELMSTQRREVRRWAWAVLVLAGGTAAGLNTWHTVEAGTLPPLWAVVVGIGPVLLAVVLSHLVALVLSDPTDTASVAAAPVSTRATATPEPAAPAAAPVESSRAAQVPSRALSGPGVHHSLAVVPPPRALTTHIPTANTSAAVRPRDDEGTDPRVERLAEQLRGGMDLTGAAVAGQLGCSPRTGRRLLRQAEDHTCATSNASTTPARERGTG